MWIYSEKQKTWINLNEALRIASDGQGGYLIVGKDGNKSTIDQAAYDKAMEWVDPDWYKKHPDGSPNSLNIEAALKAIIKATGAKLDEKGDKKDKEGED